MWVEGRAAAPLAGEGPEEPHHLLGRLVRDGHVKTPDVEEEDLVRLASITENNWTVWRNAEKDERVIEDEMNSGDHDEDDNQVSSFEVPEMDSNQAPSESCQQVPHLSLFF